MHPFIWNNDQYTHCSNFAFFNARHNISIERKTVCPESESNRRSPVTSQAWQPLHYQSKHVGHSSEHSSFETFVRLLACKFPRRELEIPYIRIWKYLRSHESCRTIYLWNHANTVWYSAFDTHLYWKKNCLPRVAITYIFLIPIQGIYKPGNAQKSRKKNVLTSGRRAILLTF